MDDDSLPRTFVSLERYLASIDELPGEELTLDTDQLIHEYEDENGLAPDLSGDLADRFSHAGRGPGTSHSRTT
jgi:hypothetical protein